MNVQCTLPKIGFAKQTLPGRARCVTDAHLGVIMLTTGDLVIANQLARSGRQDPATSSWFGSEFGGELDPAWAKSHPQEAERACRRQFINLGPWLTADESFVRR